MVHLFLEWTLAGWSPPLDNPRGTGIQWVWLNLILVIKPKLNSLLAIFILQTQFCKLLKYPCSFSIFKRLPKHNTYEINGNPGHLLQSEPFSVLKFLHKIFGKCNCMIFIQIVIKECFIISFLYEQMVPLGDKSLLLVHIMPRRFLNCFRIGIRWFLFSFSLQQKTKTTIHAF